MLRVAALVTMKATTVGPSFEPRSRWSQASESFDEQVHPLVAIFVAPAGEEVDGFVEVEAVGGEEMPHHEFVDGFLVLPVKVLEFVQRGEALDVQAVGENQVGLAAEEFFGLETGDLADGGENRRRVRGGFFDREARINIALGRFFVRVQVGEMVVEVGIIAGEISPQQRGMGGEDGGHGKLQMRDARDGDAGHPFVEMGDDRRLAAELGAQGREEFRDGETERDDFVDFPVARDGGDEIVFPEEVFVGIKLRESAAIVEQDHPRPTGDEPAAVMAADAHVAQAIQRFADDALGGLFFKFQGGGVGVVGTDEAVAFAPALEHRRDL